MKRFLLFPALIIAFALCLSGCSSGAKGLALPAGTAANYMEQRYMLPCAGGFVCQCDDMHYRLFTPDGARYLDENAVEAVSQKFQYLFAADGDSVVYGELVGAERYGRGTGWRLYRWYPGPDRRELIYKDTAVSGTDGLLGLEDVLELGPLTVDHYNDGHSFFLIDGGRAVPEYEIAGILRGAAEENGLDLKLPDSQLRFAVSGNILYFAGSLGALYRFDTVSGGLTALPYPSVSGFFATADRLFVIPAPGADIDVLDHNGNRLAQIETGGLNVCQPLVFDGDDIYLGASGFEIVRIDGSLALHRTGAVRTDNRWTVVDGVLYCFENGTVLPSPTAVDTE